MCARRYKQSDGAIVGFTNFHLVHAAGWTQAGWSGSNHSGVRSNNPISSIDAETNAACRAWRPEWSTGSLTARSAKKLQAARRKQQAQLKKGEVAERDTLSLLWGTPQLGRLSLSASPGSSSVVTQLEWCGFVRTCTQRVPIAPDTTPTTHSELHRSSHAAMMTFRSANAVLVLST